MFTSLCGLGDALLVTKQQHPLQNSHFRSRVGQHTARYLYVQLGEHLTSATFQISTVTATRFLSLCPSSAVCES